MKSFAFGIGVAVFSLGLSTVLGYALDWVQLYNWDGGTGMALNTGVGFMLTGTGIALLSAKSGCLYVIEQSKGLTV